MEWPKLKNIILIILGITNVFLLSLVGFRSWNAARYRNEARSDALLVLEQNGIRMEAQALPEDISLPVATVTRDREGEAGCLRPLLGEISETPLAGGQYRYTGEKGEAYLQNRGEFFITLTAGAYPAEGEIGRHAVQTLSLMGVQSQVIAWEGDASEGSVTLLQLWEGVPVRSCAVTAVYARGELTALSGTRLNGTPVSGGKVELSAVTGLLRFVEKLSEEGSVCSEILSMSAEYRFTSSLTEPSVLWPVWYFETDTGSYRLDTTTGQLSKL